MKLTAQKVSVQVLGQAQVRGAQCVVQLVETTAVVLAFQVTLDALEGALDALETGLEGSHLVS